MAVRPLAATISVALPRAMADEAIEQLFDGMFALAGEFGCAVAGGDTNGWDHPLAVDVAMIAAAFPGVEPVRRSGARPGDGIYVTGPLGGSLLGRHLTFSPKVSVARSLAERLRGDLHAMMDISDGLSLDLYRLCRASETGATLQEALVERVISDDARQAAKQDGRPALDHALSDGEDFELLLCVAPALGSIAADELGLHRVGTITEQDLIVESGEGHRRPTVPRGYQHR
jgi:thiamine-monophosphate kinase